MTLIDSPRSLPDAGDAALWHEVEKGFWVGSTAGVFLGTIEAHGENRFFARNSTRAYVGEYRTLADARGAVAADMS